MFWRVRWPRGPRGSGTTTLEDTAHRISELNRQGFHSDEKGVHQGSRRRVVRELAAPERTLRVHKYPWVGQFWASSDIRLRLQGPKPRYRDKWLRHGDSYSEVLRVISHIPVLTLRLAVDPPTRILRQVLGTLPHPSVPARSAPRQHGC